MKERGIGSIRNESTERYLQNIGLNLQLIMKRLMANQNLLRYLKYTDKDPLSPTKPDIQGASLLNENLLIIPVIGTNNTSDSKISLKILKGLVNPNNTENVEVYFSIEVFVPLTQWQLKSDNLRPYLIMGEISKSILGKKVEGLGEIVMDSFQVEFFSEEMSCYEMIYHFTTFK